MVRNQRKGLSSIAARLLTSLVLGGIPAPAWAAESVWDALTAGRVSADLRYRYEWVDQSSIEKDANASTLRTRLGYSTGTYRGASVFLEFENVAVIGGERYNNTKNNKMQYPIVADPKDTEVNQVYLKYEGLEHTVFQGGRRRLILDNARFVGNVGWRQNEQTFDALSLMSRALPYTDLTYVYVYNVNRIFGEHHPGNADFRMSSHLVNLSFRKYEPLTLTAYAYLLDFDDVPANSTKTFGLRLSGSHPLMEGAKILYAAEYAAQSDFADGPGTNDAPYLAGELGGSLQGITLKAGYEELGGDGVYGFSTPLATLHAFQGWADKFLNTPKYGVRDLFFTLSAVLLGARLTAVYHDFSSDHDSFDYGTEVDLLATKTFAKRYALGIKYARYRAEDDAKNSGITASDVDKLWLMAQLKF